MYVPFLPELLHPAHPMRPTALQLTGEGYQDDITFDLLPGDKLDELRMPDGPLGPPRQHVISVSRQRGW